MASTHSFWDYLKGLFAKKRSAQGTHAQDDVFLEPKYWQEVIEFIATVNNLIASNTIEDGNIQSINARIVSYIEDQINHKGTIVDLDERYRALDTLADRISGSTFSKIVGLKHIESSNAEFSAAVQLLKKRLHERHRSELSTKHNGTS